MIQLRDLLNCFSFFFFFSFLSLYFFSFFFFFTIIEDHTLVAQEEAFRYFLLRS